MRIRIISSLMLGCLCLCASAQETGGVRVPDNEAILETILDKDSPYNYTALMVRYRAGDTTLTKEEYHHLYYGYAWQSTYKPLDPLPARDKLLSVLEKKDKVLSDYERIIEYGEEVMLTDPFSPSNINFLTYAYGAVGDTLRERINHKRLEMVLETIHSSGSGLKEESPWHVLSLEHAADVMGTTGEMYRKPMIISRTTEYFPLMVKKGKVKGYYFDYSRAYWNRPEQIPQRKKNGWQFNGIPMKSRQRTLN